MPKMKSNKSASKRFSFTKKGKVKRKKAGLRHILSTKSPDQKRGLRKGVLVNKADQAAVERMLPYGR